VDGRSGYPLSGAFRALGVHLPQQVDLAQVHLLDVSGAPPQDVQEPARRS